MRRSGKTFRRMLAAVHTAANGNDAYWLSNTRAHRDRAIDLTLHTVNPIFDICQKTKVAYGVKVVIGKGSITFYATPDIPKNYVDILHNTEVTYDGEL